MVPLILARISYQISNILELSRETISSIIQLWSEFSHSINSNKLYRTCFHVRCGHFFFLFTLQQKSRRPSKTCLILVPKGLILADGCSIPCNLLYNRKIWFMIYKYIYIYFYIFPSNQSQPFKLESFIFGKIYQWCSTLVAEIYPSLTSITLTHFQKLYLVLELWYGRKIH